MKNTKKNIQTSVIPPATIIGEFATVAELVKAMNADFMASLKGIDLSFISERADK